MIKLPIPKPGEEETEDEFISRCVPIVLEDDDMEQDQAVAICYDAWREKEILESTLHKLNLNHDVEWDEETKTLAFLNPSPSGRQFGKFSWMPDWKLPDWANGRLYFFTTLGVDTTLNKVVFDQKQKIRCAGSLVHAPINENHIRYALEGFNAVLDAEEEDNRVEGIAYVEDAELNAAYDRGDVIGVSIDYIDRNKVKEDKNFVATGTTCLGLAFVTKEYLCGDPTSRLWRATDHRPEERDIKRRTLIAATGKNGIITSLNTIFADEGPQRLSVDIHRGQLDAEAEGPTLEERMDWLEEDIRTLFNNLWTLEETYFARIDAVEKRIDDVVALLAGQSLDPAQWAEAVTRLSGYESLRKVKPDDDDDNDDEKNQDIGTQTGDDDTGDTGTKLTAEEIVNVRKLLELGSPEPPEIKEAPDAYFAFIEGGGTLDEGGMTVPRELRHLQFKTVSGNYCSVLLEESMDKLFHMITDGDISKSCAESAKYMLLEGYKALGIDIPEWARDIKSALVGQRINPKTLAFLRREIDRQEGYKSRYMAHERARQEREKAQSVLGRIPPKGVSVQKTRRDKK